MPKRKEDVSAKNTAPLKSAVAAKVPAVAKTAIQLDLEHAHHEAWLANVVTLVTVLVFAVYVLATRDQVALVMQQMGQRLASVEAQCRTK